MADLNKKVVLSQIGNEILGDGGPVSQSLPGYTPRFPQVEMANAVGQAIEEGKHALIEAGTGTGKSLAYLIPAIMSGHKVVVSTDTIQLQEQLIGKDLPFLSRVLPVRFTYAIAKGRGNYFCKRNAKSYIEEFEDRDLPGVESAKQVLNVFENGSWDGDKSTLRLPLRDDHWSNVNGEDSCTGKTCPFAKSCVYLAAKKKQEEADVLVTNHTMYLLDAYLQEERDVSILPTHPVWIGDEAHTLSDKCAETFGVEVGQRLIPGFVKRLQKQAVPLELSLKGINFIRLNNASENLFHCFERAPKEQMLLSEFPEGVLEAAISYMEEVIRELEPILQAIYDQKPHQPYGDDEEEERAKAIGRLYDNIGEIKKKLKTVFSDFTLEEDEEKDLNFVSYAEVTQHLKWGINVTLHRKPIDTERIMRNIIDGKSSTIFTSATLLAGNGRLAWELSGRDLGIETSEAVILQVDSPFDYPKQVIGYVPTGLPEPRSPDYHTRIADEVIDILNFTQGRAFILFTANTDMKRVHELVRRKVRYPIFLQGEMPKDELVRQFMATEGSVLFGVKTFWTGVDIQGDALSCVVIVKLPFPQWDHPLNRARCERIKARGGSDFREFTLPRCIRDVKQGFGRLIRSFTDEGVFAILDPRMRSSNYGKTIASALPNFPVVSKL